MKKFDAIPHISLGPVRVGDSRSEVHRVLGAPESTFYKAPTSAHPTDAWFQSSFQVFYTAEGKVEFVEVTGDKGIEVTFFSVPIFATPTVSLMEQLRKHAEFWSDDGGHSYIALDLDIAVWRPETEDPDGIHFATFGLGERGYYA